MMPFGSVVFMKFNVLFFNLAEMCQAASFMSLIMNKYTNEKAYARTKRSQSSQN